MSEKQERRVQKNDGYQAKIDKPPSKPLQGSSNVKPPPNQDKEKKQKFLGGYSPFYLFPVLTAH